MPTDTPENPQPQVDRSELPGAVLRAKREVEGYSLEDVSRDTRITRSRLIALEDDDYSKVGNHPFIVGYIRKYAKWLGLDAEPLISAYEDAVGYEPPQDTQIPEAGTVAGARPSHSGSKALPLLGVVVALLAVGLGVTWLLNRDSGSQASEEAAQDAQQQQPAAEERRDGSDSVPPESSPTEAQPRYAPDARADTATSGEAVAAEEPNAPGAALSSGSAAVEEPAQAPELSSREDPVLALQSTSGAEAEVGTPTAAAEDTLTVRFSGDCWVEVRDANGDLLFTRLQQAGDNLRLSGQAPFQLLLGNARAAEVQVNGQPVATNPRPNRDTLRLSVGP